MTTQDYHIRLTVEATEQEAFNCINKVSQWWTENLEGSSQQLNDEFSVHFGDVHYSKQKLIEFIPGKKVVWLVTDSKLNFLEDKQEWTNTKISFELANNGNETDIRFTHFGLVPTVECYNVCTPAWDQYIKGSLFKLVRDGKGIPELKIR
ncbi:SRPBCC domain-containing protein [Rhodocytophaga rosea]|uniref:SRPBCC domain-containing protein n=1 Tax=Rhodocytophaga rosea TaxID=2704465 RepID=A0A6C0GED2_9BACT|nr:SRPBCC domain-containing protein [Rhodocytophaga rosea]QHT66369.1 SRPBCC domain-containing protein [Rhodocytophaga rosea]